MGYDNLKLEKGMYSQSGRSFAQTLEALDPSENYKGTSLEGLDAFQRQLKRFDIKVKGAGSDRVEKFFWSTESAVLFPEFVSRVVRQGMEEVLILFRSDKRLESRLEKILDISKDLENCYIGESDVIASRTTNSVMQTFHIARALNIRKRILCYHEVSLECLLNNIEVTRELEEILKLLEERDVDGVLK